MTDDEIMIEVRDWLARRPSTLMQNADWIALARAIESRVLAESDGEMHICGECDQVFKTGERTHPTPDDAKDAARYRWLRGEGFDRPAHMWVTTLPDQRPIVHTDLDAAIDAAMQADKEAK